MKFNAKGFTLIELVVSIAIIGIIMGYVVANFRTGQRSGQVDSTSRQLIGNVSMVRTWATAGKLVNGVYPPGGYAIVFNQAGNYTINSVDGNGNRTVIETVLLPAGISLSLCKNDNISTWPCVSWTLANPITVTFSSDGSTTVSPDSNFVGGLLQQTATGKKAYFYISKISGLATGNTL